MVEEGKTDNKQDESANIKSVRRLIWRAIKPGRGSGSSAGGRVAVILNTVVRDSLSEKGP